eukprot:scaffold10761_cov146-Isochrysis_galbana.AAC.2
MRMRTPRSDGEAMRRARGPDGVPELGENLVPMRKWLLVLAVPPARTLIARAVGLPRLRPVVR